MFFINDTREGNAKINAKKMGRVREMKTMHGRSRSLADCHR